MSRLTEEMVIARSKQSDLSTIKKLNCWGSELSDVSIIRRMIGVELLALSVNRVSTLADFENCAKLQELYLRKNNIDDINDLVYLQNLPNLRHLWLEENPCVEKAGPNYRQIVLRALPNLQKLDNIDVTPDELAEALRNVSLQSDDSYDENYGSQTNLSPKQQQQQQQHHQQHRSQSPPLPAQQLHQQHHQSQANINYQPQTQDVQHQQPPPPSQQQSSYQHQQQAVRRTSSPIRESTTTTTTTIAQNNSPDLTEDNSISESIPTSPQQRTSPHDEYSPAESNINRDQPHRHSYHQQSYDRSSGSDHGSPMLGYRERRAIAPSMSMQSMKDYYQSDRPMPPFYRHSQSDLTEWEDNNDNNHNHHSQQSNHHQQQQQQQQQHPQHHSQHGQHGGGVRQSHHNHPSSHNNSGGSRSESGMNGGGGQSSNHRRSIGDRDTLPYTNGGGGGGVGYGGGGGGGGGRIGSAASLQNGVGGGGGGGSKDKDDWEESSDRFRRGDGRPRRPESRFNDNASVSNSVINHYASFYRRPVNRSSNLLSAALCLVKELDYPSLEVVEHAVRCRIDELSTE